LNVFPYIPAKQEYPPKLWNLLVINPIYFGFGGFYANVGGVGFVLRTANNHASTSTIPRTAIFSLIDLI